MLQEAATSLFGQPVLLAPLMGLAQQPVPGAAAKLLQDPAPAVPS
jgi:hypothetical protein